MNYEESSLLNSIEELVSNKENLKAQHKFTNNGVSSFIADKIFDLSMEYSKKHSKKIIRRVRK